MQRILAVVTALLLALAAALAPALAERRVALVIGNSTYEAVGPLTNAVNDARDMAAALERLGFAVRLEADLGYDGMRRALQEFGDRAVGVDMAVVFYAGHGMEIDRQNYLVPVDARLRTDRAVAFEAVPMDLVLAAVEGARTLKVVLLDACRNNPFAAQMTLTGASRSIGRGLSRIEPATGTLVGFAAKEGTIAVDGEGRNSPYTAALLSHIEQPGLEISLMFRQVRDAVLEATHNQQEPFVYGSLPGRSLYFVPPPQLGEPQPTSDDTAVELAFWNSVKGSGNAALLEAYRNKYPRGQFVALAELMIEAIEAERQRLGEVAAKETADDAARKGARVQTPKSTVVASLDTEPDEAAEQADKTRNERALVLEVQQELERLGCDLGRPDGKWGSNSRRALESYARHAGAKLVTLEPSQEVLEELRTRQGRMCPLVCGPRFDAMGDRCVLKSCPKGQELSAGGACVVVAPKPQPQAKKAQKSSDAGAQCGLCTRSRNTPPVSASFDRYCGEQYLWRKRAGMCR